MTHVGCFKITLWTWIPDSLVYVLDMSPEITFMARLVFTLIAGILDSFMLGPEVLQHVSLVGVFFTAGWTLELLDHSGDRLGLRVSRCNVLVQTTLEGALILTPRTGKLGPAVFNMNMSLEVTQVRSFVITLWARIPNTLVFILDMSPQITFTTRLIFTLSAGIFDSFMLGPVMLHQVDPAAVLLVA